MDKTCMKYGHYVDTWAGIQDTMPHWIESASESEGGLFPVFEPVMMTQAEFDALPEFTGY